MPDKINKKPIILIIISIIFIVICVSVTAWNTQNQINNYTRPNNILIFYKDNCPDCVATKGETHTLLDIYEKVYWIDTNTPIGKEICKKYNIVDLPSIAYIKKDGSTYASTIYTYKNNETVLNKYPIQKALDMQLNND